MQNSSKHLRIASVLEILLGVGSIVFTQFLLGSGETGGVAENQALAALMSVAAVYAFNGFKVLAGLLGLALSNRKSLLTVILGGLLFLAQLVSFLQVGSDMVAIVVSIVLLAIPYYYLHNAVLNYKDGK